MSYRVKFPPHVEGRESETRLSYPSRTGDSGDWDAKAEKPLPVQSSGVSLPTESPGNLRVGSPCGSSTDSDPFLNRFGDPYYRLASEAVRRLGELGWVLGIRTWLEKANPALHQEIYVHLLEKIEQAWGRIPIEEFQVLLDLWVGAHKRALKEWKVHNV